MAKRNRPSKRKPANRRAVQPQTRSLRFECLEPRRCLSGGPGVSLPQLLINMTPAPCDSGDQPPAGIPVNPLGSFTPKPLPPDPGIDPTITQYLVGVEQIDAAIEDNPAARPGFWVENVVTDTNQVRVHLDGNGMLPIQYYVTRGDGSSVQSVSPQPWVVHQYPAAGQYTIQVTATSPDGTFSAASTGWFVDGSGSAVPAAVCRSRCPPRRPRSPSPPPRPWPKARPSRSTTWPRSATSAP